MNLVGKLILWVHFLSSNNPIRRRNWGTVAGVNCPLLSSPAHGEVVKILSVAAKFAAVVIHRRVTAIVSHMHVAVIVAAVVAAIVAAVVDAIVAAIVSLPAVGL